MNKEAFCVAEYQSLRQEVIDRLKILHQIINIGAILFFASIIVAFLLYYANGLFSVRIFALLISPVFIFLGFNYQANQMTMEAVAGYINSELKRRSESAFGWDEFYMKHKKNQRLTSVLKVTQLLMPQIVALVLFFTGRSSRFLATIFIIDLLFLILMIINFKYKVKV